MIDATRGARSSPRRILVFETVPAGHRLVYVRLLIEEALRRRIEVVLVTTPEMPHDERFGLHLGEFVDQMTIVTAKQRFSVLELQRRGLDASCDLIVVPDLLKYGLRMLLGPTRRYPLVRMLVMNDPRWHIDGLSVSSVGRLLKLLALKISGTRAGVEMMWLRAQGTRAAADTVVDPLIMDRSVPDVLGAAADLRVALGMEEDVFWFGVVGGLSRHKNIPIVIEAIERATSATSTALGLALLGPWADPDLEAEVVRQLDGVPFRVVRTDGHMTNEEMNVMVGALDCAVMAYSTSQPNSTTAKAAALGVRVVSAGSGQFRRSASLLTGMDGVALHPAALAEEMVRAIHRPAPERRQLSGPEGLTTPLLADVSRSSRGMRRG